jgi:ankyrin repeat protein
VSSTKFGGQAIDVQADDPGYSNFVGVPHDLTLMLADNLELVDINALARTSQAVNQLLTPYMYRRAKDLRTRNGRPYFLRAVDSGNVAAVRRFIEVGTSVDLRDHGRYTTPTALHICVETGDIPTAQVLIQNGVNISDLNEGLTPLQCAVRTHNSCEAMVRLLLEAQPEISGSPRNFDTIRYPTTPGLDPGGTLLHGAAGGGTATIVRLLLDAGLDTEATNISGETPLHTAVVSGKEEIVDTLLEWGANVHAIDNKGLTPLQSLLQSAHSDSAAHRILHHEALPEACSWKGSKACVPVCRFEEYDVPILDQLLSAGANIRASSNSTSSALAWATSWVNGIRPECCQ